MRSERYQIALIILGLIATIFFGVFFYRELYPEYRIYQNDYKALEQFRSTYTGEPPPSFREGVKQIVFEREDKGPPLIDRCTSCHVALQLPHFSPFQIAHDSNGNVIRDKNGTPVQETNKNFIWSKLDQKIAELRDEKVIQQLNEEGESSKVAARLKEAKELESLKSAHVGEHTYDVTKVLAMHPLIGKETRPFEFHPIDEYGCTSCHSGNGKGLTTEKAHGPVFDGDYETEYMGPKPEFLEKDSVNDPQFARIFNDKPADALLFQTSPILMGSLIQAKCVQCHHSNHETLTSTTESNENTNQKKGQKDIDALTADYRRGQELFITQACYACHRIAGFSRGGVGPELTRAGGIYPWFLKEKITWPQGTLKTSTMPNMHLDHAEVEDLMTFLLAQNGPTKAVSSINYKVGIQEWEAGKKQNWEKQIMPTEVHDLRDAMSVFATQGCAACHKLKGFESNVGFQLEASSERKPSFNELYNERLWFQRLFPEEITGSQIVKAIEENTEEIDKRVVDHVRKDSLLEELEEKFPGIVESFNSPFRFAVRAKNHQFTETGTKGDGQLKQWQDRVRRILMMYVQEYGLGRLIGPRPNWSGVYRSDEWLMEHFRNPSSHVPNSIMPIFPFDDTKFYALTYMLDTLGKRNRDSVNAIWEIKGFDPAQAFNIYCAQCHGDYLQGNGPVATWIYPIPKNLKNAEFLRNLTKEKAIESITHGVKGTPMAPWGETPHDKYHYDGIPILNQEQASLLANWLYNSIPGASIIKSSEEVPKWHYTSKNVVDELRNEGRGEMDPFEAKPSPVDPNTTAYYIKKSLYTQQNLEEGKAFFENNCAVCHGKEADGAGVRAGIMLDAKPRMLINLDWIKSRDDLRLLSSIKYGIPGTAMTPWGDLTNSLQRLQLVMFIRSLNNENTLRDQLTESLYSAFAKPLDNIETDRIEGVRALEETKKKINKLKIVQDNVLSEKDPSSDLIDEALNKYKEQLTLTSLLKHDEVNDQQLLELKKLVKQQEEMYRDIGIELLRSDVDPSDWNKFIAILQSNSKDRTLSKESLEQVQQIIASYENKITNSQLEKQKISGKIASANRSNEIKELDAQISTYTKAKQKLQTSFDEIKRIQQKEKSLSTLINESKKTRKEKQ